MDYQKLLILILRVLSAEFLVFGTLYVSYVLSQYVLGRITVLIRWCATIVIGLWLASTVFNFLISLGQFNLTAALVMMGVAVLVIRVLGTPFGTFLEFILEDFVWLKHTLRLDRKSPFRWFYYICIVFVVLTCLHTTILPLLGWDTLTYHGVKAGMWVQNGGPTTMIAPGGWGHYRNFFGGGEIFTAWAMLPFHSDLLGGVVEAVQWLLLGFVLYAFGREFGVHVRFRWIAAAYVLFIPCLWFSIGSGYVEPGLNLALMLGLFFAVRFLRQRNGRFLLLSLMAFGVAGGTKITALPIVAIVWLVPFLVIVFSKSKRVVLLKWMVISTIALSVVLAPWLLRNIHRTGYPLGAVPLEIAGIKLGEATRTIEWYQDRPELPSYNLHAEIEAITHMLGNPKSVTSQLSVITVLPMLVFIVTLLRLIRRRKVIAILMIGYIGAVLTTIYYPGFSVVRILWAWVTGRFLLPMVCPVVVMSFSWFKSRRRASNFYALILILGILFHFGKTFFFLWDSFEIIAVGVEILIVAILVAIIKFFASRYSSRSVLLGSTILVPLLLLPPLDAYRENTRDTATLQSTVMHFVPKYWYPAVQLIDTLDISWKIAITSGPHQNADYWFMYFFLGRKLQNQIFYIPVTEDENIIDFGQDGERELSGNFDSWSSHLIEKGITHVMSFKPGSLELSWMEERRELFERLEGDTESWGLYRVKK